ncbi:uncharacterized protein [Panulirus ornatus]|uniref:uncharacterized protein isoform X1 n=1 Tax=Panulirus ornatus TaxID=150431 RepID=UPI003A852C63
MDNLISKMTDGLLSLSWNNHSTTFCHMLSQLRQKERYTDATIACEGKFYAVHKLVLSTCSQYFEDMFEHTLGKHPVVLLQDVRRDELEALLSYMYAGIVSVAQRDLSRLIKVAELLQIKGLAVPDEIPSEKKNKINNHSVSNDKTSPQSRLSQVVESSDDRTSPHPKRRKREDNGMLSQSGIAPVCTSDSPKAPVLCRDNNQMQENSKDNYQVQEPNLEELEQKVEEVEKNTGDSDELIERTTTDTAAQQRIEQLNQRLQHQPVSQESSRNQYKDGGDESIVIKEEAWEDSGENQSNSLNATVGYGSLAEDSSVSAVDGVQEDHSNLILPKEYESQSHHGQLPPALPEVVVEALAGPSGMHEWLGGGDFAAGLSAMENYSGEGSPPTSDHPQQHQVVGVDSDSQRTDEGGNLSAERSGPNRKMHHCPYCTYSTARKDHMKEHIRTHTGERPFSCPYCPYCTAKNSDLHRHLQTHTGEKPFACSHCPFRTSRKINLKNHIRTHAVGKPLTCPQCQIQCSCKGALMQHMRTHVHESHSCPYCQLQFSRRSLLNIHMRTHTQ